MGKQISAGLRYTFLAHCIVGAVIGLSLWIIPGRTLTYFGLIAAWVELPTSGISIPGGAFVNPLMTRFFGAALLALAFSSFKAWRSREWLAVRVIVQLELIFFVLSFISTLYYLTHVEALMRPFGWTVFVLVSVFALAWGFAFVRHELRKTDK